LEIEENTIMENSEIYLTKEEALSLFCFFGLNPASVLKDKCSLLTLSNHSLIYRDIRAMTLTVKMLLNYKSEPVRCIIHGMI